MREIILEDIGTIQKEKELAHIKWKKEDDERERIRKEHEQWLRYDRYREPLGKYDIFYKGDATDLGW